MRTTTARRTALLGVVLLGGCLSSLSVVLLGALQPSTARGATAASLSAKLVPKHLGQRSTLNFGFASAASLSARFVPERLGQRATLDFGFAFAVPPGHVPPPLVQIELRYPTNLGIALSGLGLAICTAQTLEAAGPAGCPPNSVMGHGQAFTGIELGTSVVSELAPITVVRAPDQEGRLSLLFFAEGATPVDTHIVFPGILLPANAPFGGVVSIGIPLVPTLPGAPYISVIHLNASIGPIGVTYYEHVGGVTLAYTPKGILLPNSCPRGGFPFAATFSFLDGSHTSARTAVPCPDPRKKKKRH